MSTSKQLSGLAFERYFTKSLKPGQHPAELFTWTRRHVRIVGEDGAVVYEADVEAPDFWSDLAVTVAAKTWFRRIGGVMESSVRGMFDREANAIAEASKYPDVGVDYFGGNEEKRRAFRDEVFYIQAAQYAMFNTPVHVNVGVVGAKHDSKAAQAMLSSGRRRKSMAKTGVYGQKAPNVGPQASACFIQSVDDTMESLCALQTSETQLFRRSSGTGSNLSAVRPASAALSGGGTASGPVSFMRALDGWAGVTKSGGSSRRAALMRVLDVYHPDIQQFIATKFMAQKIIRDLGAEGWDVGFNAVATTWTPYQNANNSVRVDDAFMLATVQGHNVQLHWPTAWDGKVPLAKIEGASIPASALLDDIAVKAHDCGDPGMQYHTTINKWHTCKTSGTIVGSNPCSEYMFLDDSACNLASLRLTKFLTQQGFDIDAYTHVARTMFIAQEILVGAASYPTDKIAQNSHDFRPLGLGYADLGAMLMQLGLPYDSDAGRVSCAAVTSLLGGVAYETSAEIARDCGGAFPGFAENRDSMLQVISMHEQHAAELVGNGAVSWLRETPSSPRYHLADVARAGELAWNAAAELGSDYGFRNAQATVLAPTGTIGFALDCDTTGIEPDTALVKRKKLAGGGVVEYVNQSVAPALRQLGYDAWKIDGIVAHIKSTGELPVAYEGHKSDGDRWLAPYHAPVFATAFGQSGNEVSVDGHLKMMATAQPFLSGAISKTVNCPASYTVADIREVFVKAWRLGLKAVAVYRDGSKDQPLEAKTVTKPAATLQDVVPQAFIDHMTQDKPGAPPCPYYNPACTAHEAGVARGAADTVVGYTLGNCHTRSSRRRLPVDAAAHRHKFSIAGVDGYVHLGFYPDTHTVGEVFMRLAPNTKGNAHLVVDSTLQAASIALQHGADLHNFLDKWEGTDFAPSGFTGEGPDGVVWASSPLDYLAKWLRRFLEKREQEAAQSSLDVPTSPSTAEAAVAPPSASQAPSSQCPRCHAAMRRDGACTSCPTCGYGQGGCGG